jgi:RNA polymerase sigma-70 factor, ECF subfamily
MTDFHDLYTRHSRDVFRFAYYLSGDATEAEEILAETFARALTTDTPLRAATVKAYLLTIARNLYLEFARRKFRHVELTPEVPDRRPDLERTVEGRLELSALMERLKTAPEIDRAALLLRADGLAYEEIAGALSISLAAAKVKVHRLRLKLAEWRAARDEESANREQGTNRKAKFDE